MIVTIHDFKKFISENVKISIKAYRRKVLWEGMINDIPKRYYDKEVKSYAPESGIVEVGFDQSEYVRDLEEQIENKDYPTLKQIAKLISEEDCSINCYDFKNKAYYPLQVRLKLLLVDRKQAREYDAEEEWEILQYNAHEPVVRIERDYMDSYDYYDQGYLQIYTKDAGNDWCDANLEAGGSPRVYKKIN